MKPNPTTFERNQTSEQQFENKTLQKFKPVLTGVAVGGGVIVVLLASGLMFRVLAWTKQGWNDFKGTWNK